jgi:hypothetical protein
MFTFYPNCTLPADDQGFVASPNVRSTFDIIGSCIATLGFCCWSILHLNVPPSFQTKTRSQRIYRGLWGFWQRVKWAAATLLAPEALLAKAATDYLSARWNTRAIKTEFSDQDTVPWTTAHSFLADMGGFAIRFPSRKGGEEDPLSSLAIAFRGLRRVKFSRASRA